MSTRSAPSRGDAALARVTAETAGRTLLDIRTSGPGSGARGDAAAQSAISSILREARPGDAVLSEEAVDDAARLTADRVWIVDPLDGTREFGEPGRVDWAVHVALWDRGDLVVGAVALPAIGITLATDEPPIVPAATRPVRVAVSRTRPPGFVERVAELLSAQLVPMGSAGYKAAAVVRGEVDAYVHAGGQYEWDSAAPVAVARAAGLHTSRIDGSPLRYNRPDPLLPDLLICRPELADRALEAIAAAGVAR
ncbi:MAG: 3'(2'),5'-bisphosphate nucleotidase CysQ [Pseudonocardia sp.]|nr:3'(2'),5'-bisphosphate nucleotidase CysQ [Pseudonocardia sp.]